MNADEPTLEQRVARLEALVEALQAGGAGGGAGSAQADRSPAGPALDPDTFWALEELIRRALLRTGGNRTRAAELLELSYRALLYKIKEYRIDA